MFKGKQVKSPLKNVNDISTQRLVDHMQLDVFEPTRIEYEW